MSDNENQNQEPNQEEELMDVNEAMRQSQQASDSLDAEKAESEAEAAPEMDLNTALLQEQLEAAELKSAEHWDKFMRLQAEMDNLRRRNEKQVEDAHKFALKGFVEDILPVVDSLEMGLQAEGGLDSIREGMNLTLKQFEGVMDRRQVLAVGAEGDAFNPELHQAVSMVPSEEHEDNTLMNVMQKGYTLNGRLVRPAMVVVCKKA